MMETAQEKTAGDVEAILRLKYAYFRLLDTKQFDTLGELLTEDVTTSFESGRHSYTGRGAVVEFLRRSLGDPGIVHFHNGHHPEIDLGDAAGGEPLTATGTWYLEDRVYVPSADFILGGTALYTDAYVRTPQGWLISHTGYERIYEERRTMSTGALQSFTSRFDPA